jgi:CubicO group peptidase (beta-lactamase class C family)
MTSLVLATAVASGELTLDTTVGEVLGTAAHRVAPVTLVQLATHTSGLPRLAPNHRIAGDDPEDPYARFDEGRLLAALAEVTPAAAPTEYSNFGFQILGYALEQVLAMPLTRLFQARIFDPLGMTDSRWGDFREADQRIPGYGRKGVVPFWGHRLVGAGGVACSIADLARYVTAMYDPPDELFGRAVELATSIHATGAPAPTGLAWILDEGLWCHSGATAGFGCFVAFHGPSRAGGALAMNSGGPIGQSLHGQGLRLLADVVRDRSSHLVDFDAVYAGAPSWDIGRPQPAMLAVAQSDAWRGRVLDVGCGTGEHALLAASLGLDATGVDSAPAAIGLAVRKAADRGLPAHFVVGNALDLDGLGIFDTVVDTGLFHVFDDEQRPRYVDSLASAVRPGGSCYLLCFSEHEPGGWPPRRVSEMEIRASFAEGWKVDWVRPATFELSGGPGGPNEALAWLAKIDRQ